MKKLVLLFIGMLASMIVMSQDKKSYNDIWFMVLNHYKLNEKWMLGNEIHWRNTNFLRSKEQLLLRPFVSFKPKEVVAFSMGYSYIRSYPFEEGSVLGTKPEHNLWEQISLFHKAGKFSVAHRYRLEHRIQGVFEENPTHNIELNGFDFTNRIRYRITFKRSISDRYFIMLFDEVWITANDHFDFSNFDRNWAYVGVGKRFSQNQSVQLAYLHQSIRKSDNLYQRHPTIQLTFQIDFVKG